jgi:hypothetical protein
MLCKSNKNLFSLPARLIIVVLTAMLFIQFESIANPTGLIDNFALGISRSKTPEQLKAERDEPQEEPFFILQQSGNIIFQVLANGNIEWSGTLNHNRNTTTGNLIPVAEGIELGSTESSWGKLYLNEMYFPLLEKESNILSSEKVDATLNQLEAVQDTQNTNDIQLRLKSNKTVSVKNPNHRSFYNVSHIIPILIKRLQDDRQSLELQASQILALEQKLNLQTQEFTQLLKDRETKTTQLQNEKQQLEIQTQKNQLQLQKKLSTMENDVEKLKNQLKLLTSSIEDKLKLKKSQPEKETPTP